MLQIEECHNNFCPLQNMALNGDMHSVSSRHAKWRSLDVHEKLLND